MVELLPVVGQVVVQRYATDVVAPPYDVLTEDQRRTLADRSADSFLRVLPSGDAAEPELRANRAALDRLLATGRFRDLDGPTMGVLRLEHPGGATVAVLGDVEVAAFLDGRVLPHERVRADRVEQLAHHLAVVGIASSPVCVAHHPSAEVAARTAAVQAHVAPAVTVDAADGVRLTLHLVTDPAEQRALSAAIDAAGRLFIADGHHRAAAVGHHAADGHVFTAVVPSDQLQVLAFHRRLDGLAHVGTAAVLSVLAAAGLTPVPIDGACEPQESGVVHLTVDGRWWSVPLRGRHRGGAVESLDVRLVEREMLTPLASLGPEPQGAGVVAVPAPVGLDALVRPGSVGLALHPPTIDEVMAIAAAGAVMPAKSTYLAPKLRSGLMVVPRRRPS